MTAAVIYERCSLAGVPPHILHDYTFREAMMVLRGFRRGQLYAMQRAITAAWLTAHLSRVKHNKFPKLGDLLRKLEPARTMTVKQIRSAIFALNAAMGGKVIYKGSETGEDDSKPKE